MRREDAARASTAAYAWLTWSRAPGAKQLPAATGYLRILPETPAKTRRESEREAAAVMPADWQQEVAARRAARIAREKARRQRGSKLFSSDLGLFPAVFPASKPAL